MRLTFAAAVLASEAVPFVVSAADLLLRSSSSTSSSTSSRQEQEGLGPLTRSWDQQKQHQSRQRRHLVAESRRSKTQQQTIFPECDPNHYIGDDMSSMDEMDNGSRRHNPKNRGLLRNGDHTTARQETTSSSRVVDTDADVGVLSCGVGQYCMETSAFVSSTSMSSSSSPPMAGICVDHDKSTDDQSSPLPAFMSQRTSDIIPGRHHLGVASSVQSGSRLHRSLQTNESDTSLIQVMYDLCYSNLTSVFDVCMCAGIDVEAYKGSILCSYQNSCFNATTFCGEELEFCFDQTYSLTVLGSRYGNNNNNVDEEGFTIDVDPDGGAAASDGSGVLREATMCGHLTSKGSSSSFAPSMAPTVEPSIDSSSNTSSLYPIGVVDFQYCYDVVTNATATSCASMTINEYQECSYCSFPISDGDSRVCTMVTCGETDMQFSGNFCEMSVRDVYLEYNVLAPKVLPCPNGGCNLCGDGSGVYMSNPTGVVMLEEDEDVGGMYGCGQMELAALTGTFDAETCSRLEVAVADICGCLRPFPTITNPTSSVSDTATTSETGGADGDANVSGDDDDDDDDGEGEGDSPQAEGKH